MGNFLNVNVRSPWFSSPRMVLIPYHLWLLPFPYTILWLPQTQKKYGALQTCQEGRVFTTYFSRIFCSLLLRCSFHVKAKGKDYPLLFFHTQIHCRTTATDDIITNPTGDNARYSDSRSFPLVLLTMPLQIRYGLVHYRELWTSGPYYPFIGYYDG